MNGCEAGIVVTLFSVFGFGVMSWVDLWRIDKRLDRIEKSLTSATKEHSNDDDGTCSSEENEEHTLE